MSEPPRLPERAAARGLVLPPAYLRFLALGVRQLDPWELLSPAELLERAADLGQRYPTRCLVPFARHLDGDDLACFEAGGAHEVALIHDFASPGWEGSSGCSFRVWVLRALDDYLTGAE